MGTPVSVKVTAPSASATSFEVDLGPNIENDLIVIELAWRTSGTLAISGFTALGTKGTTDAWDSQWFAKVAGVGGESNPTASTTGPSTPCGAISHIIRGADVSGGAAAAFDAIGSTAGSAGATLTSHALTTTVDDCLILQGAVWDNTGIIADPADCNLLGGSGTGATALGIVSAATYKATAGTIPTFTWAGSNASNTGRAWALAIKNASGGSPPVRLSDGRVWLQKLGGFSSPTAGLPDSVTGLTAIDGLNMNTVANTASGALTIATGQPSTSPWPLLGTSFATTQNLTADAWVGSFQSLTSVDISGDIITIPYGFGTVVDTVRVGAKGAIVVYVDNANAWAAFQILPQSKMSPNSAGVLTIKPGTTAVFDESGGIDWTQIVNKGYFHHRKSGTATNVAMYFYPSYREASVGAMLGGGASLPVTTQLEAQFLSGGNLYPGAMTFQGSGQLVNRIGLQLGDGTNATYAKHTAQSYDIPATDDSSWRVGVSGVPIKIKASSSDTIDLRSAIVTSSILQPFTIDAASDLSATLLTTGLSVIGRTFSDLAGYDWTGASWTECDTVAFKNGDLTNCTIASPNAAVDGTTGAACSFSASGAVIDGSTISCVKASGAVTGYHAAFGAALTAIEINNTTLSGTPGTTKFYSELASGTLTITTDGLGTALADTDVTFVGGSTAIAVIAAPELYQEVAITGLAATYRLQIFDIEYDLTVSGITVTPTAGATYTHNGITWTVRSASITAGAGTITVYGTGTPATSGTLTKTGGTGDASVAFSAYVVDGTQLYQGVPGATFYTWTDSVAAAAPRVIRVRVTEDGPGTSDAIIMIDAIVGMCGTTEGTESVGYLVAAVADSVYNDRGVDGSTITGITIDDVTLRFELTSGTVVNYDGVDVLVIDGRDIYAYETYWLGTAAGIIDEARIITAVDAANYRCSRFKFRNDTIYPVLITNAYMVDAATGIFATLVDYSGGQISNGPDHVAVQTITTSDAVVSGTLAEFIAAVPTATDNADAVWAKTLP